MATVVTVEQLNQVATAQKTYIDRKNLDLKTELTEKVDNLDIPAAADAADISGILDIFGVE